MACPSIDSLFSLLLRLTPGKKQKPPYNDEPAAYLSVDGGVDAFRPSAYFSRSTWSDFNDVQSTSVFSSLASGALTPPTCADAWTWACAHRLALVAPHFSCAAAPFRRLLRRKRRIDTSAAPRTSRSANRMARGTANRCPSDSVLIEPSSPGIAVPMLTQPLALSLDGAGTRLLPMTDMAGSVSGEGAGAGIMVV